MITKILDNYCTKRLKQLIDTELCMWNLDFRYTKENDFIQLYVKKRVYNDKMYRPLFYFRKDMAICFLCDQQELKKTIRENIEEYCKECAKE